jgi:hypothetical protein
VRLVGAHHERRVKGRIADLDVALQPERPERVVEVALLGDIEPEIERERQRARDDRIRLPRFPRPSRLGPQADLLALEPAEDAALREREPEVVRHARPRGLAPLARVGRPDDEADDEPDRGRDGDARRDEDNDHLSH